MRLSLLAAVVTALIPFTGQYIARMYLLAGSLQHSWLMSPLFSILPFSLLPTAAIAMGYIKPTRSKLTMTKQALITSGVLLVLKSIRGASFSVNNMKRSALMEIVCTAAEMALLARHYSMLDQRSCRTTRKINAWIKALLMMIVLELGVLLLQMHPGLQWPVRWLLSLESAGTFVAGLLYTALALFVIPTVDKFVEEMKEINCVEYSKGKWVALALGVAVIAIRIAPLVQRPELDEAE